MVVNAPALPVAVPGQIPNGVWTVINEKAGTHRTVKVETVDAPEKPGLHGKRIVYLMNGTDNLFDFTGVAFLETKFAPVEKEYDETVSYTGIHDDCGFTFEHDHVEKKTRSVLKPQDEVVVWKRLKGTQNHKIIDAWFRIITVGISGARFELAKHCVRCNRLLTNPESIALGVGPICAQGGMDSD
jgi:hypothetical protein